MGSWQLAARAPIGAAYPLTEPRSGLLVVRQPAVIVERFRALCEKRGDLDFLARFRRTMSSINPASYRGMCRDALEAYPTQGLDVFFKERGEDLESDKAARKRFLDLLGSEGPLIPDIGVAKGLHSLLDRPSDWEIICVSRETSVTALTLGFDLGWWGSPEYYSIIWDSAIAPTWHGPPEEDWDELATALKALNKQALFDSPSEATAFRDYYVPKPWAEREDDLKFEPIRIEVPTGASRDAS